MSERPVDSACFWDSLNQPEKPNISPLVNSAHNSEPNVFDKTGDKVMSATRNQPKAKMAMSMVEAKMKTRKAFGLFCRSEGGLGQARSRVAMIAMIKG